jgi:HAE1 family hydrophobic/amphiphilic exporter-1
MRRHLYTFILSAGLLASGAAAEVSAQTNEKNQIASVKTNFDSEKEKNEAVEKPAENPAEKQTEQAAENKKFAAFVPRPFSGLTRIGVTPGQVAPFTLNEAIRRALENNNDIEVARNDVRLNEQSLIAFEGFYDPFIGVTPTFTRSGTTGQSARNDFTVNTDFSKNIKVGGGFIRTFYNNQRTENRFQQAQVSGSTIDGSGTSALFSSSLGFSFTQPLWRDRAIDNNRRNIKIQRKRLEQSDADFRQRTIDVIAQVQRSYWDLVFALRDQQNRLANLDLTKQNLRRVEAQISAGAAAPLARAEVATELANRESDLLLAAQNVTTAENTLKQLILRDPNAPEWSTQMLPTDEPSFDQTPVKLDDALAEAKQNRPELRRLNLQREINDIDVKYFKNQTKPVVDLTGSVYLNGIAQSVGQTNSNLEVRQFSGNDEILLNAINLLRPADQQIPNPKFTVPTTPGFLVGSFAQSNANLFRSDAPTYQVGVTIQIPVGNRTAKANLAGAQIQQTRLDAQKRDTEQLVIAEVRNSVQAVETARQRVLTARIARENAEIQLQGEQKLYEVGRSTTFLLFQRENALANARNSEIRAETDFNKALADLQRATSTTLRTNNIIIESVVAP